MKHISNIFFLTMIYTLLLMSCQDEVLVKTEDTTKADALLTEIADAKNQLMTFVADNNALTISNVELERTLEGLLAEYDALSGGYDSEPTEVHLTVNVISAANAAFSNPYGRSKSVEGLVGATVKVTQNGKDITPSSSANGLYLFKGLVPGQVALRVEAVNHTTVVANIIVWINDDEDAIDAEAYNASTQIVLFPNAGSLAGKLVGNAYANTSTLDDTLGRRYGTSAQYSTAIQNTYITQPGPFYYDNYTQDVAGTYRNRSTLYSGGLAPEPVAVKFADVTESIKIYARPYLSANWGINNSNLNGYITSITYIGMMTSTMVKANGTFELPLTVNSSYDDYDLFDAMEISSDLYVADHERLTISGGNYFGQFNETGSIVKNFRYYNNGNTGVSVFTGSGTSTTMVNPNAALVVARRVITEKWEYSPVISHESGFANNYTSLWDIPSSGQTVTRNIYFFPTTKLE